jgi:hypothetical protein
MTTLGVRRSDLAVRDRRQRRQPQRHRHRTQTGHTTGNLVYYKNNGGGTLSMATAVTKA